MKVITFNSYNICFLIALTLNLPTFTWSFRYEPNWKSLDSRPLPSWYDEAKIGIFIHWGVFSVPSFGSEWFWKNLHDGSSFYVEFMKKNYRPGFTYQDFGPKFTAEFYNPEEWADIFNASGARYIVLTSKHHEGYTLWPSKYSWNWNAMDVGPGRDLIGDLTVSIEVNLYKPEIIWSDGDGEALDQYWKSKEFLAWLFNESPVKDFVVVNDRWGKGVPCHHGSFYTCHDRYNPGKLLNHKWENCMTLDKSSWGFRREAKLQDYLTIHEVLTIMAETVSCGGNLLVNTGPTHDGRIAPIMEERLRQMGYWLGINGEGIYGTVPWQYQNDTYTPQIWFTEKNDTNNPAVYAIVLNWPEEDSLILGAVKATNKNEDSNARIF
ncbi:Alpha-L-fucosidase [Armadillidium vulgare]|nr:Alpha-L-fucosidase [Armadillidium vulgare]